ncbi:MAG: sporulation integral membrane protein YtvI [Roseburia sp.]|nr:sporulation integral membrane protein YtvI [Roseburia sp.]MCM1278611.1 sporulation integral membrane protein YtvI [Robinsoniella sp.]
MRDGFWHYGKITLNFLIALFGMLLVVFLVPRVLIFFSPFVIGWLIAWVSNPLVGFVEKKIKIRRKAVSVFLIAAVIAFVSLVLYGSISFLVHEIAGFLTTLPSAWAIVEETFVEIGEKASRLYGDLPLEIRQGVEEFFSSLSTDIGNFVGKLSEPTVDAVGNFAKNLPSAIVNIIICLLSAYFFIAERDSVIAFIKRVTPAFIQNKWHIVYESLATAVGGYVKAQVKIEARIYVLLFIGLLLLKVKYFALIALMIALIDIFPIFGMGAVLIPWAVIELFQGQYYKAIGFTILWCVGNLVRQIIQPKIVGESMGLPTIPTLFLIYIGWRFSGVIGMLIAVPLGMLFVNLVNAGVFDTVRESFSILGKDIAAFRVYTKKDREYYKRYLAGDKEAERKLEASLEERGTVESADGRLTKEKDEEEKKG